MIKDLLKNFPLVDRERITREQAGLYRTLNRRCEGMATISVIIACARILAWIGFDLKTEGNAIFRDLKEAFDYFYREYEKEHERIMKKIKKLEKQCTPTDTY